MIKTNRDQNKNMTPPDSLDISVKKTQCQHSVFGGGSRNPEHIHKRPSCASNRKRSGSE